MHKIYGLDPVTHLLLLALGMMFLLYTYGKDWRGLEKNCMMIQATYSFLCALVSSTRARSTRSKKEAALHKA